MAFQKQSEFIDIAAGMHVITLQNEQGHQHILQIAIGHTECVACGHAHAKDELGDLDPKAALEAQIAELDRSHAGMREYAEKHRIPVK